MDSTKWPRTIAVAGAAVQGITRTLNSRSIFPNGRSDLLGLAALVVEVSALIAADAIRAVIDWAWEE